MRTTVMMGITQVSRLRLIDFANVSHPSLGDGAKLHEVNDDDGDEDNDIDPYDISFARLTSYKVKPQRSENE